MQNRLCNRVATVLEEKKFKDFSRTFNSLFQTYPVDVLPSHSVGLFSDGGLEMFLASYKTLNCVKFLYWIVDLGIEYKILRVQS